MSKSFENRVALVTGGSTGIGAAAALELAEGGASVIITGRTEATLRASAKRHARIDYVVADVANSSDAARTVDAVRARFDRLDVLVNNAGIAEIAALAEANAEHVRRIWETNVEGLIETTRLALPLLKNAKGTIVNVASTAALLAEYTDMFANGRSATVLALTRAWAKELAPLGIRVNAVSPGPIETPIFDPGKLRVSPAELESIGNAVLGLVPLARFGRPAEVASVIAFLASSAASYVTGAEYTVGGGIEA